ncbi:MAG: hypothetical protein IJB79_05675 [Candidatus Gastranaerophilales bacterium]|nr:hypothetical protein [Candidatus Gastranaerophilales bacterium]
MIKKFLVILLLSNSVFALNLKDANLINDFEYKKINTFSLKKKAYSDKKEYQKYKEKLSKEEYEIYLIADKIIRANNLQYKNWRIGFNLEKDVINAVSLNNNLILINSSLYDCLHQNKDALAYAIAHELAHFILLHQKETIENTYKIKRIEEEIKKLNSQKYSENYTKNLKNLINNIYLSQRKLELNSDSLALELIIKAGFNLDLALEIFDYIDEDYNFYENKNIYPLIYERKENLLAQYDILNIENLKKEGENNLFNSKTLSVQKSMDKETLVLNKPENYKDYSFVVTNKTQKLLSKAYFYYKKEDIKKAIEYFSKAHETSPNNYIAPLYLSYAYEFENDIKLAKRYIKKAKALNPKSEEVIKQYKTFYKR